jgi:hypothetical protein
METSSGEEGMVFKSEEAKNSAALLLGKVTADADHHPPHRHDAIPARPNAAWVLGGCSPETPTNATRRTGDL